MEGGLFLVFVIIAMAARAIEAISKNRQGGGTQQRPQPQPGRPQPRPRPEYEEPYGTARRLPEPPHEVGPTDTADAAAEMIPDELWQILTGQPKPRRPSPPPLPVPYDETGPDEELVATAYPDEEAEYERRRRAEQQEREREARELRERRARGRDANMADKAPRTISLERPLPSPEQRHAAFHRKVDAPIVVAKPRRPSSREWLFSDDDMKRAIVLQEVLGTPKGLQ